MSMIDVLFEEIYNDKILSNFSLEYIALPNVFTTKMIL
jgi:hypothetical protein